MALTIRDLDDSAITSFKELTGKTTASGALIAAAQMGVANTALLRTAERRIMQLEQALQVRQQALANLKQQCGRIIELAGQTDLFVDGE
ncbi:hypothetical protein DM819_05965 [Pseudomonas hunanensis]|uniref:Uncharacterized protein n=1 Tax=Pseudomonas hunanensis TaxID=1247546 RepID=A0ABD6MWV5_9PSED|nr:hypothetical protein [Pseudomonas hunanensis]ALG88759.1 Hypothetical protein Drgb7_00018 [uncultured bacterium]NWL45428.1 hypothetical protein [Pseudomonas hunanensis]